MKKIYEVLIISAAFLLICFVYRGQHRSPVNPGWDASYYYKMAEAIRDGANPVAGELPFIKRIGTPFLIARVSALTGLSVLDSALYVNLVGSFIAVILLLFWLRIFFEGFRIRALICFLFMMAWHVPLRFSFYNPMTSDAWGAVWMLGGLLLLQSVRRSYRQGHNAAWVGYILAFSVLTAAGIFFREANAVLCLLPILVIYPLGDLRITSPTPPLARAARLLNRLVKLLFNWKTLVLLIPLLCVVFANVCLKRFISVNDPKSFNYLWTALSWLYIKSLPEYVLGILIAYGPLILLLPFFYKKYKSLLREKQELTALLLISLLLGLIGGSDTERILFMSGFPVILVLMGIAMRSVYYSGQRWWFYLLLVLQSISFRFFWPLPDYPGVNPGPPLPFFGLLGSHFKYLNLYSRFSNYYLNSILLLEFLVLFLATWYVLQNKIVLRPGKTDR